MRTSKFAVVSAVAVLSLIGAACGNGSSSNGHVRNAALLHCLNPVVQSAPEQPAGYGTYVGACNDAKYLVTFNNSSPEGSTFQNITGGVSLNNFYPYVEVPLTLPNGPSLAEAGLMSVQQQYVVALDSDFHTLEWLRMQRDNADTVSLHYSTPTAAQPADLPCIDVQKDKKAPVLRVWAKVGLGPCVNTGLNVAFSNNGTKVFHNNAISRLDVPFADISTESPFHVVTGTLSGDPTGEIVYAAGQVPDLTNASAMTFTQVDGGTLSSTPTTSSVPDTSSSSVPDTSIPETSTSVDQGSPSSSSPVDNSTDDTAENNDDLLRLADQVKENCDAPDWTATGGGPDGQLLSSKFVTIRPELSCAVSMPDGFSLLTIIQVFNDQSGDVAELSPRTRMLAFHKRLRSGHWNVRVDLNVGKDLKSGGFASIRAVEGRSGTIDVIHDSSIVECDGSDFKWDGVSLSSDCLKTSKATVSYMAGWSELFRTGGGLVNTSDNGVITPQLDATEDQGFVPIEMELPRSEGQTFFEALICATKCDPLPTEVKGLSFSSTNRKYVAKYEEGCSEDSYNAYLWGQLRGDRMISYPLMTDDVDMVVNYPGTDAEVSGTGKGGTPIPGTVISATAPDYADVYIVSQQCILRFGVKPNISIFKLAEKSSASINSASQDQTDVQPVRVEAPAESMTGQPIGIVDGIDYISVGLPAGAGGYQWTSVKATIDGGESIVLPRIGAVKIPVTKDSKQLTVTYTKADGSTVVVTKSIIAIGKVESGGSSTTLYVILALVLTAIAGAGVALSRKRKVAA